MRATGKTSDMTLLWIFLISMRFAERLCVCKFYNPPDEVLSYDTVRHPPVPLTAREYVSPHIIHIT